MSPIGSLWLKARLLRSTAGSRGVRKSACLILALGDCLLFLPLFLALLAGCQAGTPPAPTTATSSEATPIPAPTAEPAPAPIDLDRLDELLELGDQALRDDRLLTPVDDSAYDYYQAALKVAPRHPAALHGLDRLVDRYIALAGEAAQRGQYERAKNILERAKFVNADHEGLPMAEAQLDVFEHAKRRRVVLDASAVSARSAAVTSLLADIGGVAKAEGVWVVISARSDAEGRWIYQQLRRAPGERRIRAELIISGTPSVEIVQIADQTQP